MHPDPSHCALWLTEYNTPWDGYRHGILEVVFQKKTSFQELMIVTTGAYGKALVLDGCWQASTADEFLYHEPLVHAACVLQGGAKNILILGGGDGAALREALKWQCIQQAVVVDLDGEVVDACRRHLFEMHQGSFDDPRSQVVIGDAFEYVDTFRSRWDVIVSDLTDPLENGPSARLFSREYFQKCRRALAPGGCFVLQAGLAGPVEMGMHTRLARTVAGVFDHMLHFVSHVPTWASPMGFVIGSDRSFEPEGMTPEAVDQLLSEKSSGVLRMFDGRTFRGLMHPPKYLRDAVAAERRIYDLGQLPRAH